MAAYGAAISLKTTIQNILQSSCISLVSHSQQILPPAYEAMSRLQKVLLKLDETGYSKIRTKVNALDEQIKEVVWEFEDLLESHVYQQILPQLESSGDHMAAIFVDLQSLQQSVDCFVERVKAMEAEYDIELLNMPDEEGEPLSSRIDCSGINSKMVRIPDDFGLVRDVVLAEDEENCCGIIGMAGVGKTTFAKKVFDDPLVREHFEHRAWVKVGKKCESNETLKCILAQLDPNTQGRDGYDDEKLAGILEERLKDKQCLIVLDDVWEWDTRMIANLPQENVRILFTSRLNTINSSGVRVNLLDEEESKKLLGEKVFGEEGFPPHLEKLGEIIANKCEGLPLMLVTVGELLSKEDKTPEFWTEVAGKKHNSIFVDAYSQISEVLFPSYEYLPQYLKMLFLYLGSFPPYINIGMETFCARLCAEGFLEPIGKRNLEDSIYECAGMLSHRHHLVLFETNLQSWFSKKMFRVHSCWQHLCKKEASKIKFMHVLQGYYDDMKDQRRLCAHSNNLFAFQEVYDSIKSDCASTVRSLLCLGPNQPYPVPIHALDFKLLKVLDALKVRFYHIPPEITKLVCLKFFALTCNKEIPVSISNLFQLQSLFIYLGVHVLRRGVPSDMPVEIWNLKELQHIQVMRRDLPIPISDVTLDKLSTLLGVSVRSCTREILKRVPNLKSLGILMELKPYDDDINPLSGLDNISEDLQNLITLSYMVVYPDMKYESMVPLSMFPSSLVRLQLTGLGCPWKHMNEIGAVLPNLKGLKLQLYAFQGPEWNIESGCFLNLQTLVIEDADLVRWTVQHGSLPRLHLLSIRHCYKLQQLDWARDPSMQVTTTIELVESNPLAVASAKQLRPESHFKIRCYSSF